MVAGPFPDDRSFDTTLRTAAGCMSIHPGSLFQEAYSEVELTKIVRGIGAGQDMIHLAGSDF